MTKIEIEVPEFSFSVAFFRLWFAMQFLRMACRLMGGVEEEVTGEPGEEDRPVQKEILARDRRGRTLYAISERTPLDTPIWLYSFPADLTMAGKMIEKSIVSRDGKQRFYRTFVDLNEVLIPYHITNWSPMKDGEAGEQ